MADISSLVRTDFKAVDKREPLHAVKGWLTGDAEKVPIILDDGKPMGIVNERAIMGRHLDPNAHIQQFALATRPLTPETSVEDARAQMAQMRAAYLPVSDKKGKLLGYVRAIDLARGSLNGEMARELAVNVTNLREDQTLGDAVHAFNKEYVEFLPVLGRDGRLGGVLSRSDVIKMEFDGGDKGRKDAGGEKIRFLDDAVGGLMDTATSVLSPDARPEALLDRLEEHGYAIVGAANGKPLGLVTPETLFRARGR